MRKRLWLSQPVQEQRGGVAARSPFVAGAVTVQPAAVYRYCHMFDAAPGAQHAGLQAAVRFARRAHMALALPEVPPAHGALPEDAPDVVLGEGERARPGRRA